MAFKVFALVLAVAIIGVNTLPARNEPDDVELVSPRRYKGSAFDYQPDVVDIPADYGGFAFPSFPDFQDYFKRIRESIAAAFANASQGIDLSKGNTTSETKIIDGNLVTINRTVYNEDGVHVVVKNVEVRPVDSEATTGSTPAVEVSNPQSSNAEDIETFGDRNNERLSTYDNLESFDEVDFDRRNHYQIDDFDELRNNDIESIEYYNPNRKEYDLGRDTYVNEIMAQNGAPRNPDAEDIDVELNHTPRQNARLRNARK